MAIILNIDTAIETGSVCLSRNGKASTLLKSDDLRNHATWLHPAIQSAIQKEAIALKQIEAIAVTIGPGSYTGLRIGLSAAKGLCFSLNIPLIAINTLKVMAHAIVNEQGNLLCPLIDARRNEVFTAVYDKTLKEILLPSNTIINEKSFEDLLIKNKIIFSGTGSLKLKGINNPNAVFSNAVANAADMAPISESYYKDDHFANLAYTEPLYLKEFYLPVR